MFAETTFSLVVLVVVVLDRIEFLFLIVILFSKRHFDDAFLMREEDKRFEFVLVALKVLKLLLLFTVVVAIVVIIVCVILNVCVCLVCMFSARVKCLSSELRIPPFILFISNELLKTYMSGER